MSNTVTPNLSRLFDRPQCVDYLSTRLKSKLIVVSGRRKIYEECLKIYNVVVSETHLPRLLPHLGVCL